MCPETEYSRTRGRENEFYIEKGGEPEVKSSFCHVVSQLARGVSQSGPASWGYGSGQHTCRMTCFLTHAPLCSLPNAELALIWQPVHSMWFEECLDTHFVPLPTSRKSLSWLPLTSLCRGCTMAHSVVCFVWPLFVHSSQLVLMMTRMPLGASSLRCTKQRLRLVTW